MRACEFKDPSFEIYYQIHIPEATKGFDMNEM